MRKQFKKTGVQASAIIWAFILMSCATQTFLIEVPQKSKNELPDRIQSVLLISRVADDTYTNLDADSLQKIFYKKNFNCDTIINDSMVIDTTLKTMGDILFESGRYDYVIPEKRFLPAEKNSFLIHELPWSEVKNLCETYNTDAVISVDHFKTRVNVSFNRERYFNPFEGGIYSAFVAKMNVPYEALIRVYDPVQEKVLVSKLLQDTLFWEDDAPTINELFSRFTPVKNALMEAGTAIAMDFSDEITTNWRRENREFFVSGNNKFKEAAPLVLSNQWNKAITLWEEVAKSAKSKGLKSKAEFNIALGYELLGNVDQAIEWALKSYNTMYRPITYNYLETLKRRKNELNSQQP